MLGDFWDLGSSAGLGIYQASFLESTVCTYGSGFRVGFTAGRVYWCRFIIDVGLP